MPAMVGKGYNCLFMLWEGRVQAPMRGKSHYANSACIYFFKSLTSHSQERIILDPKLHLAMTSDRVVTKTSSWTCKVKKHGEFTSMVHLTPVDPCFPDSLR